MYARMIPLAIRRLEGYTPGEQPAPGERVVKLNTNENPFPPSPRVIEALRNIDPELLRRYPNPTADMFRAAAAKMLGVSMDMIIAGNGSDDILSIAARTFLTKGHMLACPEPTYSLYPVLAAIVGARCVGVPWEEGWQLPVAGLLRLRPRAIFLANPNAPTGTFVPPESIEKLASAFRGVVLVDEAYVDFADADCVKLVSRYENVVVCRTLSKSYSLAGLRFGYAVAQPAVIREMMKIKDSYNCDAISIVLATAAIEDQEYARRTWQHIRSERARLAGELAAMGWQVLPSQANFLLAGPPDGDGRRVYLGLKERGILVRYFDKPGLRNKVRITIGTTEQNNALLEGIRRLDGALPAQASTPAK